MPEERSAAVRKDGELLANTAKVRRQKEAATDERQVAAGEQPFSSVREELRSAPPLEEDPEGWLQGAADADQQQSATAEASHGEAAHENSESIQRFEEILRQEAREMLTGYLSVSTVRRVVKIAGMSDMGLAMADANVFMILLDFVLQIFVYIFSIYLCIVYAPIFLAKLFLTLGLRLML